MKSSASGLVECDLDVLVEGEAKHGNILRAYEIDGNADSDSVDVAVSYLPGGYQNFKVLMTMFFWT